MSQEIEFSKFQGTGNDFVLVFDPDDERPLSREEVIALCDRRFGIGADGLIRLVATGRDEAPWFMDHANADGSAPQMCGNGIRCVAAFLHARGSVEVPEITVATRAGDRLVSLDLDGDRVRAVTVSMGSPAFAKAAIPMRGPAWETFLQQPIEIAPGTTMEASALSMGNPHVVVFIDDDPEHVHVPHIGPALERHDLFPERANVEFARVVDGAISARVWERGSGETMACGTGACAVAVAANEAGLVGSNVAVRFPGGDLSVERRADGEVLLTGAAEHVFDGRVTLGARIAVRRA